QWHFFCNTGAFCNWLKVCNSRTYNVEVIRSCIQCWHEGKETDAVVEGCAVTAWKHGWARNAMGGNEIDGGT
ncbi:hypothetical protein A2U01_0033833, partial [Trifolium medium]|nr:hypothetical protein [Trifolium medium]